MKTSRKQWRRMYDRGYRYEVQFRDEFGDVVNQPMCFHTIADVENYCDIEYCSIYRIIRNNVKNPLVKVNGRDYFNCVECEIEITADDYRKYDGCCENCDYRLELDARADEDYERKLYQGIY
jgi:hypothetical protein